MTWLDDLRSATSRPHLWIYTAWKDIHLRYRRSLLGPFWMTVTMGAFIAGLGPLYASLFGLNLSDFFLHLAAGFITWNLISTTLTEQCSAFTTAATIIKQTNVPLSAFVLRTTIRNLLVTAHHALLLIPVYIFVPHPPSIEAILSILGVAILALSCTGAGFLLAIANARFRDVHPLVTTVLQLLFFLTPIIWKADQLPRENNWAILLNPFFYLVEIVRQPLLGTVPGLETYAGAIVVCVGACAFGIAAFSLTRQRVAYWL